MRAESQTNKSPQLSGAAVSGSLTSAHSGPMSITEDNAITGADDEWEIAEVPFTMSTTADRSSGGDGSLAPHLFNYNKYQAPALAPPAAMASNSGGLGSSVAKSLLPTKKRLRLDPPNKLFFPYEPGKQVRSAIRIKNTSKSHVAFKFQTTAPKSCFMRPPGGILAPGEIIIATVFKFVEPPEEDEYRGKKNNLKFKIMSLKMETLVEYVPELFDKQKDRVSVEQILRVVFLDADRPSAEMDKLKSQLAEAEAGMEARKKPLEDTSPKLSGEGLVVDGWKERRERFLAQKNAEGVDITYNV